MRLAVIAAVMCFGAHFASAQDYDAWQKAVGLQYEDAAAFIHFKQVEIDFKQNRKTGVPKARLHYLYRIDPVGSRESLPFSILLDSHSKIRRLRTEGRRMKPSRLEIRDYSEGGLVHSDVSVATFPLRFGKRYRERRVHYTIEVDDIRYLPPEYFHDRYAIFDYGLSVVIPNWLDLGIAEYNLDRPFNMERTISTDSKGRTTYTYTGFSFEPGSTVEHLPPPSYIYPHILFAPRGYDTRKHGPDTLFQTLADLYTWYRNLAAESENGLDLNKYLGNVIRSDAAPRQKMEAIFYWIQDNIRYLAFERGLAGYRPQPAGKVMENRYGDCKGMAVLTRALMRRAGLDARLAWLGSSYLAYDYDYPSLAVDNHMICAVKNGGRWIYLDPTERYIRAGEISSTIAGKSVMIENGTEYILEGIPERDRAADVVSIEAEMELVRNEVLRGALRVTCAGSAKTTLMERIYTSVDKSRVLRKFLELEDVHEITAASNDWDSWQSRDSIITLNGDYGIRHVGAAFGDQVYLAIAALGLALPPEISENRRYPYVLPAPWTVESSLYIGLPQGYTTSYVPSVLNIRTQAFIADLEVRESGDRIEVVYKLKYNVPWIYPDQMSDYISARLRLIEALNDHVILEKM